MQTDHTLNKTREKSLSETGKSLGKRHNLAMRMERLLTGSSRLFMDHTYLRIGEVLYLFLVVLSFYLLVISRSEEVHTVWEVMHPAFIPVFFATTFLLVSIVFSSERAEHKLLLVIIHSILSQSKTPTTSPPHNVGGVRNFNQLPDKSTNRLNFCPSLLGNNEPST